MKPLGGSGPPMIVTQLFISPGHNFVGHHGLPAGQHPVVAVDSIECAAGRGIRGDRFFDHKPDFKGQITFFAKEVADAMARELDRPEIRPELTRRNVVTRGVDLATLIGIEFEVQGVRFVGTEECRPCYWMNEAFGDDRVEGWLQGRGGLRARILTDGVIRTEGVRSRARARSETSRRATSIAARGPDQEPEVISWFG